MEQNEMRAYLDSLGSAYLALNKGDLYTILVSFEDYERIARRKWHIHRSAGKGREKGLPYARTTINGKKIYMHRLIMGVTDRRKQVDHKNHDTLDNRRENLEVVDAKTNQHRRRDRGGQ